MRVIKTDETVLDASCTNIHTRATGVSPQGILFFDDEKKNIAGEAARVRMDDWGFASAFF